MKRWNDIIHIVILVLLLIIANVIGNSMVKGILLFLLSGVLTFNAIMKLKLKKDDKFREKFLYGILLFMDVILAILSIFVIVSAILE